MPSLHRICEGSEGTGNWAVVEGLEGGIFVLYVSPRLCSSIHPGVNELWPGGSFCRFLKF